MKRAITITGIVIFALFYCFTTCKIIKDPTAPDSINTGNFGEEKSVYFSSFDTSLFYYLPKNESSLNTYQNNPTLNLKNQFSGFYFLIKSEEKQIKTEFIQYVSEIRNVLIRFRKTDSIFPFHYFW